jgi:hypothetical protein
VLFVAHNPSRGPQFELYITDGTALDDSMPLPRNHHNVETELPARAVLSLAVYRAPDPDEDMCFKVGATVEMHNVRVKEYQGGIELAWSDKISIGQDQQGFKTKKCKLVSEGDGRSVQLER